MEAGKYLRVSPANCQIISNCGLKEGIIFPKRGNLVSFTNKLGNVREYEYDKLNRLKGAKTHLGNHFM